MGAQLKLIEKLLVEADILKIASLQNFAEPANVYNIFQKVDVRHSLLTLENSWLGLNLTSVHFQNNVGTRFSNPTR